jgi:hypothetical protein
MALMRHVVRDRICHAAQAVHEDAVIVFGVPVINDAENDQRSHNEPHRIFPQLMPDRRRSGRQAQHLNVRVDLHYRFNPRPNAINANPVF